MTTFTQPMDRDLAARYGWEAVEIGEAGHYQSVSGATVEIGPATRRAIDGTVSYPPERRLPESAPGPHDTRFEVTNETTLSAAKRLLDSGYHPVALNFASANTPGGGFLSGARAQEEYLARSSSLYYCLNGNPMYDFHRQQNDPYYSDYVLYSPDVPVFRADDSTLLDVPYALSILTSPAVMAKRINVADRVRIGPVMEARITKVLAAGIAHGHDAIVLGAWGCGAFGNDGTQIARLFHKALTDNFAGAYRHVIFAIVDWSEERRYISPFEAVFRPLT